MVSTNLLRHEIKHMKGFTDIKQECNSLPLELWQTFISLNFDFAAISLTKRCGGISRGIGHIL